MPLCLWGGVSGGGGGGGKSAWFGVRSGENRRWGRKRQAGAKLSSTAGEVEVLGEVRRTADRPTAVVVGGGAAVYCGAAVLNRNKTRCGGGRLLGGTMS